MKKLIVVLASIFTCTFISHAAEVDTVVIYSKSMQKEMKCVVIKPSDKQAGKRWPVVYLLHGYSGNYSNWITRVPQLMQHADEYQLMIVCPDGGYSSWYFDSPADPTMRYETHIAKEVPAYIDEHYPTIRDRAARAITGLSMGGHGGLFLGLRHADFFGACGSMSGGVDLFATKNKFDITKRLGDTSAHSDTWRYYSVINLIENYPKDSVAMIIDCGVDDFFFTDNRGLHEKLLRLKIPHEYIERPGAHNWAYWSNAVQFQLLYFRNYFNRRKS